MYDNAALADFASLPKTNMGAPHVFLSGSQFIYSDFPYSKPYQHDKVLDIARKKGYQKTPLRLDSINQYNKVLLASSISKEKNP